MVVSNTDTDEDAKLNALVDSIVEVLGDRCEQLRIDSETPLWFSETDAAVSLDLDSLDILEILAVLEDEKGFSLGTFDAIESIVTVGDLANAIG
ncbi:MAG: hypothetical protein WB565_17945 [Acidimicrobiales bacterium]